MKSFKAKNSIGTLSTKEQLEKLEAPLEIVLSEGSIKKAMSATESKSRDLWQVEPKNLFVIDGLNPRVETASYKAHIDSLVDSMLQHGFYQDKPLAGYVSKDGDEEVILIYEGGSRLAAARIAIEKGAGFDRIPVSVSQSGINLEDINVAMVRGNTGRPLSPYEVAVVAKRLSKNFNWEQDRIATELGYSAQYVDNMLKLMASDYRIREMVATEALAFTEAVRLIKQHGEKAVEKMEMAMEAAKGAGKTRITGRFTAGAVLQKAAKKSALPMYEALKTVKSDEGYAALSTQTQETLAAIMAELEAIELKAAEAEAAKANPKAKKGRSKKSNVVQLKAA